jgi:type II secretory pathway pseudopilin PulG
MIKKRGQVWVETVLYTLIGLVLIGLVLAFIMPKINQSKDRLIVEEAIESLNVLDSKINIKPGNRRVIDFTMKTGDLFIDASTDQIIFNLTDLTNPYSEPGSEIEIGRVKIISFQEQDSSSIMISLDYAGAYDLTYDSSQDQKKLTASSTPYKFSIENQGSPPGSLQVINIEEISGS